MTIPVYDPKRIIKFTDLEVSIEDLNQDTNRVRGIVPYGWHRVSFEVSEYYGAVSIVEEWLTKNCQNKWYSYSFSNLKSKKENLVMVVYFEVLNDALFFKLQDGHNSWKNKNVDDIF